MGLPPVGPGVVEVPPASGLSTTLISLLLSSACLLRAQLLRRLPLKDKVLPSPYFFYIYIYIHISLSLSPSSALSRGAMDTPLRNAEVPVEDLGQACPRRLPAN